MFTIWMMSLFSSVAGKLAHILSLTVHAFAFLLTIFNVPSCSVLSPTCHTDVPYGTPIQHVQCLFDSKLYSRKGSSNRLPYPFHRRNGYTPSLRLKSSKTSILDNMLVSRWRVMLPFLLHVTNFGTSLPLNVLCNLKQGVNPITSVNLNFDAAIIIAHMMGCHPESPRH
jgi:hypothetical protein